MKKIDFVRNYILDYFETDEEKFDALKKYWIPLEEAVHDDMDKLEKMFQNFLNE